MTSSKYNGDDYLNKIEIIRNYLTDKRYNVIREKVEIFPLEVRNKNFIYYESHLRLKLKKDFDRKILEKLCEINNFHSSKNLFKSDEEYNYQMITYRDYHSELCDFKLKIDRVVNELNRLNIAYDKIEIEECVYDSNISIDKKWLN